MTFASLSAEQLVIAQIQPTVEATVAGWTLRPDNALDLDWAPILLLANQHRVEGLLEGALKAAGCADQVPTSVLSVLRRRADLAESRYQACVEMLRALYAEAPDLVSGLVFFKGARLLPLYEAAHHRMLGDFDLIVAEDRFEELRRVFEKLGFWEKPGRNGPTFFGNPRTPRAGCEYVAFDIHLAAPAKYNRSELALDAMWLTESVPYAIGEVPCRGLSGELELLELLVHASEHASSWIHVCLDDDVRLIRVLDVERLCASTTVDAGRVAELGHRFGLAGELALGLAQVEALRGALPPELSVLHEYAAAGAPFVDEVALPDGRFERFDTPLARRAFRTDRSAMALRMVAPDKRHRRAWFDWRHGLTEGQEDVAAIAARARERIDAGRDPTRVGS